MQEKKWQATVMAKNAAAKAARCHEFIEKMPEGYQTASAEWKLNA